MTKGRLPLLLLSLLLVLPLSSCALFEALDPPKEYVPYDYDLSEYIVLGEYRALSINRADAAPTETEIEAQMEADFSLLTHLTDCELKLGDTVNLNYTATFDGKTYDDDTEAGFEITLGEQALGIPGFDEGLVGATPGDTIALDLTFPKDYEKTPEYAGKDVSFLVEINYVRLPLPTLTDELVSKYTTYKTVEAYEAGIYDALTDVKIVQVLWQRVVEDSKVLKYPEKEYENYYTEYLDGYTTLAQTYDMTLSELVESMDMTMDTFYREADEETKRYLKEDLIVYAIARAENLTLSEEEYQEAVQNYYQSTASAYYVSQELMEQTLGKEILTQQFISNKVLDYICSNAVIAEG